MAPEATKPTGKAVTPQKDDAPEVKGPLSVLSDREKEIMLQCMLTVKGLSAVSSSSCRPRSFHLFNRACFDPSRRERGSDRANPAN